MRKTTYRSALVAVSATLLVWLACATSSREIDLSGTSETTVTATQGIHFTAKGPITFPESYPGIGGLSVAPGVEVDVELEPGESIVLEDVTDALGNITVTGVKGDSLDQRTTGTAATRPAQPAPIQTVTLDATVHSSSTYTWRVPALFGDSEAVINVTGSVHAEVLQSALIEDDDGGGQLDPSGLLTLSYTLSGPPAVWQAPIETPYGTIEGTGSIETSTSMLLEFDGDLDGVSGSAVPGFTDPDGFYWDYGYTGALPVKLTVGSGSASGASTVQGGLNLY
ncbi:MAG: hypothetical protein PVG07_10535 [Acidobacteriota bacterium]|jgi:hypothetical protein